VVRRYFSGVPKDGGVPRWEPLRGRGVKRYLSEAALIPIGTSPGGIRSYVEMKLNRSTESEAINREFRAEIVRVIQEKISDM